MLAEIYTLRILENHLRKLSILDPKRQNLSKSLEIAGNRCDRFTVSCRPNFEISDRLRVPWGGMSYFPKIQLLGNCWESLKPPKLQKGHFATNRPNLEKSLEIIENHWKSLATLAKDFLLRKRPIFGESLENLENS